MNTEHATPELIDALAGIEMQRQERGPSGEHRSRNAGDRAAQEAGPDHESTRHSEERPALAPAFRFFVVVLTLINAC